MPAHSWQWCTKPLERVLRERLRRKQGLVAKSISNWTFEGECWEKKSNSELARNYLEGIISCLEITTTSYNLGFHYNLETTKVKLTVSCRWNSTVNNLLLCWHILCIDPTAASKLHTPLHQCNGHANFHDSRPSIQRPFKIGACWRVPTVMPGHGWHWSRLYN